MKITAPILARKLVTVLFVTVSVAAFATLGDGGKKKTSVIGKSLLSKTPVYNFKTFSLKTGYHYRGAFVFSNEHESGFMPLNSVVTYQKGNTTYILPIKKKLILDKIKFTPGPVRY